ncbi:MAG TPA: 16S rRNA (uracil(1498)-N(3))-methyltransferase [Acetobacteraceae bacterium]|nr:16S rRNA (uracil(1498)-N(3))-methyltransferase [Acetobacteraceae bacterium]
MPGSIRLFVAAPLAEGAAVAATPEQARYLGAVMRRAVGDHVLLFNGADGEWLARIATLGRGAAGLIAERRLRPQRAEPDLWLVFALLKRDATDLVVQKATELGAAALFPLITERTNAARVNEARLAAIAAEAAEQSERLTVPAIHPPQRLAALLETWPPERPLYAALERTDGARPPPATGAAGLLIGPEGGFTPAELDALARVPFVRPVSLGPRILRAETAAFAGLALLQAEGRD